MRWRWRAEEEVVGDEVCGRVGVTQGAVGGGRGRWGVEEGIREAEVGSGGHRNGVGVGGRGSVMGMVAGGGGGRGERGG